MRQKSVIRNAAVENPIQARILGAAFKAFVEDGYAGTSTLDIATRAKVSKRDLYANFGSKHEMLVACIKSERSACDCFQTCLPRARGRCWPRR